MGNPTAGTLRLSAGLEIERCNPSFVWSDDSRYLAVPVFFFRLGILRRQRVLVVDVLERQVFASRETTWYFQPESFVGGRLIVTKNPFRGAETVTWEIPAALALFRRIDAAWHARTGE